MRGAAGPKTWLPACARWRRKSAAVSRLMPVGKACPVNSGFVSSGTLTMVFAWVSMRLMNRTVSVQLGLLLEIIERERCSLMGGAVIGVCGVAFQVAIPKPNG